VGLNEHLRKLATKVDILDGVVTLWYLPFAMPYSGAIWNRINDELPGELAAEDKSESTRFMIFRLMECFIVDARFGKSDSAYVTLLKTWWEMRELSITERFAFYDACFPFELLPILSRAYTETRQSLPKPSDILMEGPPDSIEDPLAQSAS